MLERLLKWGRRADVQAKMPGAAENFKPAEDPFNKTPDWLGTLAGLLEECARSTATASVLPRTSERAKGGKELQARLAAGANPDVLVKEDAHHLYHQAGQSHFAGD